MRVGLVRNVGLGMVALVAVGLAGCDDKPTDFSVDETVDIFVNPSAMTIPAGVTTLLEARTENQGNEPTWEEIEASIDATCGSATLTIAEAASYVPEVQPPGQFDVTGGNTIGTTCITLSGGGVTETVDVTVVGDSLAILNLPASDLLPGDTIQLSASLLSADLSAVGPFDPLTDVVFVSDNLDVLAPVDTLSDGSPAPNGTFTAVGAGAATVTATWTDGGVTVTSEETITVDVPIPTLTSLSAGAAEAFETVTITGTGFIPGVHVIFFDGFVLDPISDPMIVNETTATFGMPAGAAAADIEVTIGVPGLISDPLTIDRICGTNDQSCATEPGNDTAAGAAAGGGLPLSFSGFVDGSDHTDLIELTLAAGATFDISLTWTGESGDIDVVFTTTGATDYSEAECGFATATGAVPETGMCTLAAGTYYLWVESYDGGSARYLLELTP